VITMSAVVLVCVTPRSLGTFATAGKVLSGGGIV